MTNIKNFIPRRKYRQRGQLKKRQHLGILQKKKDYKKRAKDYHEKMDQLNKLKLQASLRNPDQFYFKMVHAKKKDGKVQIQTQGKAQIDQSEYLKLLKQKNAGLVRLQQSICRNNRQKMLQKLQLISQQKPNNIEIYVDNEEQLQNFDLAQYYNTYPQILTNKSNILTKKQLQTYQIDDFKKQGGVTKDQYKKLLDQLQKQQQLAKITNRLDYQRKILNKERRKKVIESQDGTRRHKFFRERKR